MNSSTNQPMPQIEARFQIKQMLMLFAFSLTAFLVLFFFAPVKTVYLAVMGIGLVVVAFYLVKNLLDRSPTLIINQQGIFDKRMSVGTILWKDIKRVYCVTLDNIDHVCLELQNENKYSSKRSSIAKLSGKAYKTATDISPYSIVTNPLDVDQEEVFEAIMRGCEIHQNKAANSQTV